jgi:hypothetical protein
LAAGSAHVRICLVVLALAAACLPSRGVAQAVEQDAAPFKDRHIGVSREEAAERRPRSEGDQVLVGGWPLYRTDRAQEAFNDAMATLKATEGPAPALKAFKGCAALECDLLLPTPGADGWIPAGRIWVSPSEYVLIVHSPRHRDERPYRRRTNGDMRYFVFHEFLNSTRNTDPYDTISSHGGSVFVPFYMSKQGTDAKGRHFVVVVQVAPYDVVSIHATDKGSAGPGIEVAKNTSDALEPLQALAGILVATIVKTAAPHLQVVNHRGNEGLPMLSAYERRLLGLRARPGGPAVALPFVPAAASRVATATGRFENLIAGRGESPDVPIAERGIVPLQAASLAPAFGASQGPTLIGSIRRAIRPPPPPEPVLVEPMRPARRPTALPGNGTDR